MSRALTEAEHLLGCRCDMKDARLCFRVRYLAAVASPRAGNPKCYCPCHTRPDDAGEA